MNAIILWYMYRHTINIFFVTNATRYFPQVSIIHRTCIPQRNIYDNYWNTILFSIMKIRWNLTQICVIILCFSALTPYILFHYSNSPIYFIEISILYFLPLNRVFPAARCIFRLLP